MEKCKICKNDTEILVHPKSKEIYHSCNFCEFIWKDENYLISKEEEKLHYGNHNNSIEDERYVEYFHNFIKHSVTPFVKDERVGLDFGSGPSPVLAQILNRDFGYEMEIYDYYYSPEKIYLGKKYNLITSTEMVEHLENPLEYFINFKELMKEGSILALMTQLHPRDKEKFFNWYYIKDITHISFYTKKTMEYIGESLGLKLIYSDDKRYITFALVRD